MSRYLVNDLFLTLQGEGVRAGTAAVFLRFAKCNLACNRAEHGFDCDTDFERGRWYGLRPLIAAVAALQPAPGWVVLTGGEPGLQADGPLVDALHAGGRRVAIETNGTMALPAGIDWVCVSPKPGTRLRTLHAQEVKCVVAAGQEPDPMGVEALHLLVSPAFRGDDPDPDAVAWAVRWVLVHPEWRLSTQNHKWWGVE